MILRSRNEFFRSLLRVFHQKRGNQKPLPATPNKEKPGPRRPSKLPPTIPLFSNFNSSYGIQTVCLRSILAVFLSFEKAHNCIGAIMG